MAKQSGVIASFDPKSYMQVHRIETGARRCGLTGHAVRSIKRPRNYSGHCPDPRQPGFSGCADERWRMIAAKVEKSGWARPAPLRDRRGRGREIRAQPPWRPSSLGPPELGAKDAGIRWRTRLLLIERRIATSDFNPSPRERRTDFAIPLKTFMSGGTARRRIRGCEMTCPYAVKRNRLRQSPP